MKRPVSGIPRYGLARKMRSWAQCGPRSLGACPGSSRREPPGLSAGLGRRAIAQPLNKPLGVVAGDELADHAPGLLQILESMQVETLLFERPHEAFDDPVTLGLADVGGRDRDPEPFHLVDPRIGDVLRPPVTSQPQSPGQVLAEGAEGVPHALPNRL